MEEKCLEQSKIIEPPLCCPKTTAYTEKNLVEIVDAITNKKKDSSTIDSSDDDDDDDDDDDVALSVLNTKLQKKRSSQRRHHQQRQQQQEQQQEKEQQQQQKVEELELEVGKHPYNQLNSNLLPTSGEETIPTAAAATTTTTAATTTAPTIDTIATPTQTETTTTTPTTKPNALHDILLNLPSTSRSSMSLLQEEDFADAQHDYAEVLDDDTTTSGVLETFEISSSNSSPTQCSDTAADVAVVDDSSSADACKLLNVTTVNSVVAGAANANGAAVGCVNSYHRQNNNNKALLHHKNNSGSGNNNNTNTNELFNDGEIFVINVDDDDDDDDVDVVPNGDDVEDLDDDDDEDDDEEDDDDDEDDDDVDDDDDEDEDVDDVDDEENEADMNSAVLDDDEDDDVNSDVAVVVNERKTPASMPKQLNGVITGTGGQTIYLETPVVEEQQHHHHHHHHHQHHHNHHQQTADNSCDDNVESPVIIISCNHNTASAVLIEIDNSNDNVQEIAANNEPVKRNEANENNIDLDDEAMIVEQLGSSCTSSSSSSKASLTDKILKHKIVDITTPVSDVAGVGGGVKSESSNVGSSYVEGNAERMSFRLKNMSINNNNNNNNSKKNGSSSQDGSGGALPTTQHHHDDMPSGSNNGGSRLLAAPTMADIESMDLIERRDFETEQRLTRGSILKSSALANKNSLNLRLVKQAAEAAFHQLHQQQHNSQQQQQQQQESSNSTSHNSMGRAFSSDSKCTYKEPLTTPTSSRTYNSRLTKSTAKLNMNSTLSQHSLHSQQQPEQAEQQPNVVGGSDASGPTSASSSVIVEPSTTSNSNSLFSNISNGGGGSGGANSTGATTAERAFLSVTNNCHQQQQQKQPDQSESGCSRTSALFAGSSSSNTRANANNADDAEPSTSARCQYTTQTKAAAAAELLSGQPGSSGSGSSSSAGIRPMQHASAQTSNRFVSRSTGNASGTRARSSSPNLGIGSLAAQHNHHNHLIPAGGLRIRRRAEAAAAALKARNMHNNRHVDDSISISTFKRDGGILSSEAAAAASSDSVEIIEDDAWDDCGEENTTTGGTYDIEEVCTCPHHSDSESSHSSDSTLNDDEFESSAVSLLYRDGLDLPGGYLQASAADADVTTIDSSSDSDVIIATGKLNSVPATSATGASLPAFLQQRKRKYDGRILDNDGGYLAGGNSGTSCAASSSLFVGMLKAGGDGGCGNNSASDVNCRKRIAYDFGSTSTPRSSYINAASTSTFNIITASSLSTLSMATTPTTTTTNANIANSQLAVSPYGSPLGRRTPRSIIPTRENPPPELQNWLAQFQRWTHAERLIAVDRLIEHCEPTQVRHMMKVIEPQFQRDFISLLPRELALQVLTYLDPKDLLRAAQTCRSWRYLCDDNLLWKEKCRKAQILTGTVSDRPKRGRAGKMPPIASPWKAAYMRQHIIEMNWRSRPIRDPKVLKGHDEHVITCLQFSGNRIVSGSDDNTLRVWSAVTGRCLRTLVGHTGGVWSSQMSGNIIISGSTDRTLKVWDMETGMCIHTLMGHTSTVRCMHLHGNKVVSGSRDATLRVWDIEQGQCLHVLVGHMAAVRCVQYDGKLIVSGAYDYMVKIWHPERQECLHTLQGHTNRVYSLQFDGVHVVSGSLDTSIRVWDVETGNCKHTLMGHQSLTSGMELRQNILVSGNADSTVKVWDITTGQCLQTLSGPNKHQSAVTCLQFNSRFVVTSSDDGTVKLWDVKTGEFIRNLVSLDSGGSGGVVWRIRANDTKLICAVGSRNGTEETKLLVLDFDVEGACVKCS